MRRATIEPLMDLRRLDWRTVGALGATGLVPATLSLFNLYPASVEFAIWALLGIAWIVTLRLRQVPRPFLSGLLVGLIAGLVTGLVQATFVNVYLENRPNDPAADQPLWQQGVAFLALSTIAGLLQGAVVGLVAWLLARHMPSPAIQRQADRGKG